MKNLLVFADGTGNEGGLLPDESRTNVYKLFRATRNDPESAVDPAGQVAFYVAGIGTPIADHTATFDRVANRARQAVGLGLTRKIADCLVAVYSAWQPGDRIYLFGFSRGAYTVRCVAHLLEQVGIPTKDPGSGSLSFEPKSLRAVAEKATGLLYRFGLPRPDDDRRKAAVSAFRSAHACDTRGTVPYFLGLWDTVAALGAARFLKDRYDEHLPRDVQFVRHALAIDERRLDFARVRLGGSNVRPKVVGEPDPLDQVWFAGDHADIGGSYPEQESRLSDITLKWMVDFVTEGLPEAGRLAVDRRFLNLHPSPAGMMHDECMVGMGGTSMRWSAKFREVPPQAILHASVYERLAMPSVRNFVSYGPYRPVQLQNHVKATTYFAR